MRIGNPLPQLLNTVQVGGISAPTIFTSIANQVVTNGGSVDVLPLSNQKELILTNTDTVNAVYARDLTGTTAGVGTRIGALAILVLSINASVRLTNNSGASVTVGVNQTAG